MSPSRCEEDRTTVGPHTHRVDPTDDTGHWAWQKMPLLAKPSLRAISLAPDYNIVDQNINQISQLSVIRTFDVTCCVKLLIVDLNLRTIAEINRFLSHHQS